MANMKNAKKRIKQNIKREAENNTYTATMETAIKNVERAVKANDKELASAKLGVAIKAIDKAKSKGAIKANKVARNKSRLTKKVNEME